MHILALVGSHRARGNTARLVEMVLGELRALADREGVDLTLQTINLAHADLRYCRGCRLCFDRGEEHCPLGDDLADIRAAMGAAGGLLVASPVYVDDVSGVVKSWIDRLAYLCHRPGMMGTAAYALATSAASPFGHTLRTMTLALRTWGAHVVGASGFTVHEGVDDRELDARYGARAAFIAGRLYRAVRDEGYRRPSFLSLLVFAVQQAAWRSEPADTVDGAYWRELGWVRRDCTFYHPHRAGCLRVRAARSLASVLRRIVIR